VGSKVTMPGPTGGGEWRIELYTSSSGKVDEDIAKWLGPAVKELRLMHPDGLDLVPDLTEYVSNCPLKRGEIAGVMRKLTELLRTGFRQDSSLLKNRSMCKLQGNPYKGLYEVRFANTPTNLRLVIGNLGNRIIVVLDAFSKKRNGAWRKSDKEKALGRFNELRKGRRLWS